MGTNWPSLGAEPHNFTFLHEACVQLHAVKSSHTAIPTTAIGPIIDSTLRLLSKIALHLDEQPDTRLATQIQTLFKEQRDAQLKDHEEVKNVKIVAAHQLKSGDFTVTTDSLSTATELQTHTGWAKGLGPRAEVIRTTYGAIIHGIPVNTVNVKDQQGMI